MRPFRPVAAGGPRPVREHRYRAAETVSTSTRAPSTTRIAAARRTGFMMDSLSLLVEPKATVGQRACIPDRESFSSTLCGVD
jgi:hypothetical protein